MNHHDGFPLGASRVSSCPNHDPSSSANFSRPDIACISMERTLALRISGSKMAHRSLRLSPPDLSCFLKRSNWKILMKSYCCVFESLIFSCMNREYGRDNRRNLVPHHWPLRSRRFARSLRSRIRIQVRTCRKTQNQPLPMKLHLRAMCS
jgi:hypothetical protein